MKVVRGDFLARRRAIRPGVLDGGPPAKRGRIVQNRKRDSTQTRVRPGSPHARATSLLMRDGGRNLGRHGAGVVPPDPRTVAVFFGPTRIHTVPRTLAHIHDGDCAIAVRHTNDRTAMDRSVTKPILIVDDSPDLCEVMAALFELHGYRSVCATDGATALEMLHGGLRPALILLDWMMPEVDGAAFRRAQLADPELARIPVIVVSAAPIEILHESEPLIPSVVRKPVDLDLLFSLVAAHVGY
ncbi:MAG: response regulator [Thermodesulfobacteriota bacterium]